MDKKEIDFVKDGVDTSEKVFVGGGVNKAKSERIREILDGLTYPADWTEETEKTINYFLQTGQSKLEQHDFHTGPVEVKKDGETFILDENGNEIFDTQDMDFESDGR